MKFCCALILVQDVQQSRCFYEQVLDQKVKFDFGQNLFFEGGFSIQQKQHFANMVLLDEKAILNEANDFELYFEEEDLAAFMKKLDSIPGICYLHPLLEHSWGQRVIRFYDPDQNIIEVGESMASVVKRFISQGLSVEETARRTQHPIDFVLKCL